MRARGKTFRPTRGKRYKCAFCDRKVTQSMFCRGCRFFVCSACEAFDSIAAHGGKHHVEAHRHCRGCHRRVYSGRAGSWLWMEPECDTLYGDPTDLEVGLGRVDEAGSRV